MSSSLSRNSSRGIKIQRSHTSATLTSSTSPSNDEKVCHTHREAPHYSRFLGSFCGYRNIQMLISHLIHAKAFRSDIFGETYPTIFQLQDLIEQAWDMGFNAHGRVETGGIKGTRKYIGTPEVCLVQCWEICADA